MRETSSTSSVTWSVLRQNAWRLGSVMDDSSTPLTPAESAFLAELEARGVRYLVVGMSAALMQGVRGATEDFDLWFEDPSDPRIGEAARALGGFFVTRSQPPMLGGAFAERFGVVTHMSGLPDFAHEFEGALTVTLGATHLRVLPLPRILHSKRAANRAKDQLAIAQIEQTLAVLRARA